ncbi:MAG: hypothetical protein JOZ41_02770 [Chloroflexi bacterium]|nr:hypothetical protein [Chloroflexota bacterium]
MTVEESRAVRVRAVHHGLGDGRMLTYQGAKSHPSGDAGVELHRFVGADGLVVLAAIQPSERGERLHVSVSYPDRLPSRRDLQEVSAAFFPPGSGVMVRISHPDEDRTGRVPRCHLWEVTGAEGGGNRRRRLSKYATSVERTDIAPVAGRSIPASHGRGAERMGEPEAAIQRARAHVAAVGRYPDVGDVSQSTAIDSARAVDPEPGRLASRRGGDGLPGGAREADGEAVPARSSSPPPDRVLRARAAIRRPTLWPGRADAV